MALARCDLEKVMESNNAIILDAFVKAHDVLSRHEHALVSISGGADSDVMLDLVERVRDGTGCAVSYVFFDTGMEARATKRHLDDLEERYGIEIIRRRARKTIPMAVRQYGQPVFSKDISTRMSRLQKHGFRWEDRPMDELLAEYPKATTAIRWWTNGWTRTGKPGFFDVGRKPYLKEFVTQNPPWFPISAKCCDWAKKKVSHDVERELGVDVVLVGMRRAEQGARLRLTSCFTEKGGAPDRYLPILWFGNTDKRDYESMFGIRNSECYTLWGFKRTGCIGCPFAQDCVTQLETVDRYEPAIGKVARRIFADAYEYSEMFRKFREEMASGGQRRLF